MSTWDDLRSGPLRRWALCLTVGGLQERYYDQAAPPTTAIDGTSGALNYVDRGQLLDVGGIRDRYDAEGGLASHASHGITLATGGRLAADAHDSGVVFGRLTRRSADWAAQVLTPMSQTTTGNIEVDRDPSALSYPRLLHIDGETVWATAGLVAPFRVTIGVRGVARSPQQRHSVDVELGDLPQITTEVVHWRTRWATIHAAPVYQGGTTGGWVELVHGFIDATPSIDETEVGFTLVPITALLDNELAATRGLQTRTRLLQGYHHFAWPEASRWEHLQRFRAALSGPFQVSALTVAGKLYSGDATASGLEAIGFDSGRPSGQPRRMRVQVGVIGAESYEITGIGSDATGPYFTTNPAFPAGVLAGVRIITWEAKELHTHDVHTTTGPGQEVTLTWPGEVFQAVSAISPSPGWSDSSVTGADGAWGLLQLQEDKVTLDAAQLAPLTAQVEAVWLTTPSTSYDWEQSRPGDFSSGFPVGPTTGVRRIWSPIRLGLPVDESGRQSLMTGGSGQAAVADLSAALGWYQEGERYLLVEDDIPVTGSSLPIRITYYDAEGGEQTAQAEITASTAVFYNFVTVGYKLTLKTSSVGRLGLPSFADWPEMDRVEIIVGTSAEQLPSGELMLRLIESGGGAGVNGTYDVGGLGADIPGESATPAASGPWGPLRIVDEDSFISVSGPGSTESWTLFVDDGDTVADLIHNVAVSTASIVALQRRADGTCRLRRSAISPSGAYEVAETVQAVDWLASPGPQRIVDDRIVTRQRFGYNHNGAGEAQSKVEIVDQRALHTHGEATTLDLDLRGIHFSTLGGITPQLAFRPLFTRLSALLGDERLIWRGHLPTAKAALLQLGSVVNVSSDHLRGFGDEMGISGEIARVSSLELDLTGEGAVVELTYYGAKTSGFNAALEVIAAPTIQRVQVQTTTYTGGINPHTGAPALDLDFWSVGDAVRVVPTADHDAAITLTITGITYGATSLVDLSGAHGLTGPLWGTLEPAIYDSAPDSQHDLAFLADAAETLGAAGIAGDVVS